MQGLRAADLCGREMAVHCRGASQPPFCPGQLLILQISDLSGVPRENHTPAHGQSPLLPSRVRRNPPTSRLRTNVTTTRVCISLTQLDKYHGPLIALPVLLIRVRALSQMTHLTRERQCMSCTPFAKWTLFAFSGLSGVVIVG